MLSSGVSTAAAVQPNESGELARTRAETSSCGDSKSKHEGGSGRMSPEDALIIDISPASQSPGSTQAAVPDAASADSAVTDAPSLAVPPLSALAAAAVPAAGRSRASPIAPLQGAWAWKTLRGKHKPSKFGASTAAVAALSLLLLTLPYATASFRRRAAKAKAKPTEAATGSTVSAVAGATGLTTAAAAVTPPAIRAEPAKTPESPVLPSARESFEVGEEAEHEAAAADPTVEAAAAAEPWSLKATNADARWLAKRLKTSTGDAALNKIVKALSYLQSGAHEKPLPGSRGQEADLQREQQQHQREGSTFPFQDFVDGVNALMTETLAALSSEIAALKQERLFLTKARIDLQVLMEDAANVIYGVRHPPPADYVAAAQAACDAVAKDISQLHTLRTWLQSDVQGQRAASASRPGLLLKQAIVAVKAADAMVDRSRRLLNDGLQWCKLGEEATLLCAQQKFFVEKMNLDWLKLATQLEMFDAQSAKGGALPAAREDANVFAARVDKALSLTRRMEEILKSSSDPFQALDAVQTASSLLRLLKSARGNAPNFPLLTQEEGKVEAAASEMADQHQGTPPLASSTALMADAPQQKSEVVETERRETEECWGVVASLIDDVLRAAEQSLRVFHLDKPPESSHPLLITLPSQTHFEKWREAHADARRSLDQMEEAATKIRLVVTEESLDLAVSRFYKLLDTFRRHAHVAATRFYLYKVWLHAEDSLAGVVEDYKLALTTRATQRGEDKILAMEDALSWRVLAEDAAQWGVFEVLSLTDLISKETMKTKDEIAKLQAGYNSTGRA
ncbi:hypothetical protein ACSSS7_002217 [Eimeria intestinalis]